MDFLVLVKVPHVEVSGLVTLATILASFVCFAQIVTFAKSIEQPFAALDQHTGCCVAATPKQPFETLRSIIDGPRSASGLFRPSTLSDQWPLPWFCT